MLEVTSQAESCMTHMCVYREKWLT